MTDIDNEESTAETLKSLNDEHFLPHLYDKSDGNPGVSLFKSFRQSGNNRYHETRASKKAKAKISAKSRRINRKK